MGDLSEHFSIHEFVDRRTGHQLGPPVALVELLEAIRALRPGPLRVISGHRCPSSNAAVGGARLSRHLFGDAADIPQGRLRESEAFALGARGVGVADGWVVHVDLRCENPARWDY